MAHCRERRDPNLEEAKTRDVLLLHEQLSLRFDEDGNLIPWEEGQEIHVLSYDEKPGIQAIANTAPDLRPEADDAGGRGTVGRGHGHGRLGTLSPCLS